MWSWVENGRGKEEGGRRESEKGAGEMGLTSGGAEGGRVGDRGLARGAGWQRQEDGHGEKVKLKVRWYQDMSLGWTVGW